MIFESVYRIEDVASDDPIRQHVFHPYLDVEQKLLIATNGYSLAAVPVGVDEGDRSGPIPKAAIKSARTRKITSARIRAKKTLVDVNGGPMYRRGSATFPPWQQVMPSWKEGDERTVTFGIDARLLLSLAQAIGSRRGGVVITVRVPDSGSDMTDPVVVRVDSPNGEIGLLMPRRVSK